MIDTNKLHAIIDWCSSTFELPADAEIESYTYQLISRLTQLFNVTPLQMEVRGSNKGYQQALYYEQFFSIHFDIDSEQIEKNNRGIHFDITGQGCRYLQSIHKNHNWKIFFKQLQALKLKNMTRLDLAFDDYQERLSIQEMHEKVERKELVSKLRNFKYFRSGSTLQGDKVTGETLYIGSAKRIQFRFYDKLQERKAKYHEVDPSITSWQRYEIQVRHEQAKELMEMIIEKDNIGQVAMGLFKEYLSFRDEDVTDSNRSRWAVSEFWEKFIGDVQAVHLSMIYPESTIAKSIAWFSYAMSKLLARFELYSENDFTTLLEGFLSEGKSKLQRQDYEMIQNQKFIDRLLKQNEISLKTYNELSYA